jgi:hypothetical protein
MERLALVAVSVVRSSNMLCNHNRNFIKRICLMIILKYAFFLFNNFVFRMMTIKKVDFSVIILMFLLESHWSLNIV